MTGLFGGGGAKTNAASPPVYTGMRVQSSAYGIALPIVYGTTRISWNLGDYVNFQQHNKSTSGGGGKGGVVGGGGKGGGTTSVTYSASVLGFLCEGPITAVPNSWTSQTQNSGTPGFTIFDGAIAQAAWTYLSDNFPDHALTYSGIAYAAAQDLDLGSSANLPSMNWEVQGFLCATTPSSYGGGGCVTGGDADPSLIVPDLLTNPQYGAGFPAGRVGQVGNYNEGATVPGGGGTITVSHAATYLFNVNVARADGALFTCVAGTPIGSLQYSYNATTGVYTFPAAAAGASVSIRYAALQPLTDYQNSSLALGLWVSPALDTQTQASSLLDDLMLATFAELVWSSGVLSVVPRVSAAVSGNGYSYTPPTEPLFSLTEDDLMVCSAPIGISTSSNGGDGVLVDRARVSDQINDIRIECLDRAAQYAPTIVEEKAQALIDQYGLRAQSSKSLHMFCDVGAAKTSAHLQLEDQFIRNHYAMQLDERFCLLDPMDIVEVTDPNYPGMTDVPVRLLETQENDDASVSLYAEEYPGTIGVVPEFTVDAASGFVPNFEVDPGDCATPAIFDVPVQLAKVLGLETWLGTHSATGNPNWGGCEVWISSDNTTFAYAGSINGAARMGTLTANLASGSDPDTTHTLSVDLSESFGQLQSGTHADADQGNTICFVDGEYISFSTATLTSTFHYDLGSYLRRGQWGSAIGGHLSGSLFVRLDDEIFRLPYNATDVGKTIYVKLLSFNIYGGGLQSLGDVSSFAHNIDGPPTIFAPTGLTVSPVIKGNQLTWTNAPNVGIAAVEIWRSGTSAFGGASKIADAGAYDTSYLDQNGTTSGTQYWYWIRCRDIAGNEGAYDPSTAGAGATATTLQVNTADIANAAVTGIKIAPGAVDLLAFASTITPVQVVSSLGSATTYTGAVAVLTTDHKLYRWNGSAWTAAVPTLDLSGTITAGQIDNGAIDLTKFAAGITPVEIASTLPTSGNFDGRQVFLTTDKKVYRYSTTAGAFVRSVDGADLVANSVTTGSIAAAAINTAQLAAGAVSASKMFIGSTDNLIMDGACIDASAWPVWTGGAVTITTGHSAHLGTDSCVQFNSVAGSGGFFSQKVACQPGDQFAASCICQYLGGSGTASVQLAIEKYDAAGTDLGTDNIQTGSTTTTISLSGNYVVPSGVYYIAFFVGFGGGSSGAVFGMGSPVLRRRATGSLIVDGAITASKIGAGEVTAGKLAAGSVQAGNIAASAVQAGNIDANAVTAGTVAAGAINAGAIIVNDILVTGHLVAQAITNSNVAVAASLSPSSLTWTNLTSITITATGGDILLSFTDYITWTVNGPKGFYRFRNSAGATLTQVGYGGGSCPDFICSAGSALDTSGATGSQTYYLDIYWQAGNAPTSIGATLIATEFKR